MEEVKLEVELRDVAGTRKVKKIRQDDYIPAVVYGGDQEPTAVKVERRKFEKIMRQHHGQSVLFHLDIMQGGKKVRDYSVIVKDEQVHPVKENILHLDFQRISLTEELEVDVPVELRGDAVGVKAGGSLDQHMRELDIVCLPTSIPDKLYVDVSALAIGDSVYVRDVKLPQGVRTQHDPEAIIATVVPPMREEAAPEAPAAQEPEVIKKEKKEEQASDASEEKS